MLLIFYSLLFSILSFSIGLISGSFYYIINKNKDNIILKLILFVNLFVILFLIYSLEFKLMISFIIGFLFGRRIVRRLSINKKNSITDIENIV